MGKVTLIVGPSGSGKTESVVQALYKVSNGRSLFIVPNRIQQTFLKARIRRLGRSHVSVHQFYSFTRLVLRLAGSTVVVLNDSLRGRALRAAIRDLVPEGHVPIFAHVADTQGFMTNVLSLLNELQQAMVDPQWLIQASVTPYDVELGKMYQAYQAKLVHHGLADSAGCLLLACHAIRTQPGLLHSLRLLAVDGFDQFTPLQLHLLKALVDCAEHMVITLTGREQKRSAFRRFDRTLEQLVEQFQPNMVYLDHETKPQSQKVFSSSFLSFLETHLFEIDVPEPMDATDALIIIEAADREREVRAAMRRVRKLLASGVAAEHIAILFRNSTIYSPLLYEVAAEYRIPIALYDGLPLGDSPSVIALLMLLRLPLENYSRRSLVEVWRSFADGRLQLHEQWVGEQTKSPDGSVVSALGMLNSPIEIESAASVLDLAARQSGVSKGWVQLRKALHYAATTQRESSADDESSFSMINPEHATRVLALFEAFVSWLKPAKEATMDNYVQWLRKRIVVDDRLGNMFDTLSASAQQLQEPPISYGDFITELSFALTGMRHHQASPSSNHVAAMSVLASRGISFDHVVVLGMVEGEFPLTMSSPVIYSRRERALLAQQGIVLPPIDPAEERSLFYETVTRARKSLTLARTYLDERGNILPPSPYVRSVLYLARPSTYEKIVIPAGSVPSLAEAASPQEVLVAMAEKWIRTPVEGTRDANDTEPIAYDLPLETPTYPQPLLEHVVHACHVEYMRENLEPYGAFEGVIADTALMQELSQRFGPSHHWSVSQFNDYIACPFKFFATHVLNVRSRDEPEEGVNRIGRGLIYHAILADAGRDWMWMKTPLTYEHEQAILTALHQAIDRVLAQAPQQYGFEQDVFWDWEQMDIRRRLVHAVRRVMEESGDWAAFYPVAVEQGFGTQRGSEPLSVATAAGEVLVIGRVDRIDERHDGALAIIDYKSNSTPRPLSRTLDGSDVQLPVYMLAVEQVIKPGQHVDRAAFLHIGSGKFSRSLTSEEREQALDMMQQSMEQTVTGVHAGFFPVRPRDACGAECQFAGICRVNTRKRGQH